METLFFSSAFLGLEKFRINKLFFAFLMLKKDIFIKTNFTLKILNHSNIECLLTNIY